jgi:hypothetical protein
MKNSIYSINPYKYEGLWVFDDKRVELVKEPFVMGIPEMIETILIKKKMLKNNFSVLFSSSGFPDPDIILEKQSAELGGNWYFSKELNSRGWLCPALYLYFKKAPKSLYIKFITTQ